MADSFREIEKGPTFEVYQGLTSAQRVDWVPGTGILRSTYVGHCEAACAQPILRKFDALLRAKQPITMFHDFWDATGYESGLRVDLSNWAQAHPGAVTVVHFLSRSKILSMAVAVVNLAFPGLMKGYSKRTEFDILAKKAGLPLNPVMPSFTPRVAVGGN